MTGKIISVQIPNELYDKLKVDSIDKCTSVSSRIRFILMQYYLNKENYINGKDLQDNQYS